MSPAHDPTAHAHHEEEGHNRAGERRTRVVVLLTFIVMTVELVIGHYTDSMALTADGWHMGTHVGALGLTLAAYWYARTRASADTFAFGTGKVYALAGYTSGILLAGVAIWMAVEGIERLFEHPVIHFGQALPIAAAGLVVNLISAKLLGHSHHYGHDHGHDHGHSHGAAAGHDHDHAGHDHAGHDHDGHDHDGHDHDGHDHDGHDHAGHDHAGHDHVPSAAATTTETATAQGNLDFNLRAAYIHILADAMTSLLAIAALTLGYFFDLWFLDPAMGIVGGGVILWWTVSLCRQASRQLLDVASSPDGERVVRARLEGIDDVRVADLHVWLGPGRRSCIVSIVTAAPRQLDYYRDVVLRVLECAHLTIEIHTCDLAHTAAAAAVPRELQVAHRHEH